MRVNTAIIGILFSALVLFALTGCQNKYEKSGVSPIPQNSPSSWEGNSYRDANN